MSTVYEPAPAAPGEEPRLPPLMTGERVRPGIDPFVKAIAAAETGTVEPGTVLWSPEPAIMRTALVLAPDTTLDRAMAMVLAVACGINDAIGALSPPETAVHHVWPDRLKVNGGLCGAIRAASDCRGGDDLPEWLVVALSVSLAATTDDPGHTRDITCLEAEGCVDLSLVRLIESWARHTLVWINRWQDDGMKPLHDAWFERAEGRGRDIVVVHDGVRERGEFVGIDEFGNLLLRTGSGMVELSLRAMLDAPCRWPQQDRP